jgi:hypothetical protein
MMPFFLTQSCHLNNPPSLPSCVPHHTTVSSRRAVPHPAPFSLAPRAGHRPPPSFALPVLRYASPLPIALPPLPFPFYATACPPSPLNLRSVGHPQPMLLPTLPEPRRIYSWQSNCLVFVLASASACHT